MNGLSRLSGVAMVETSDQQEFNNLSCLWRLAGPQLSGAFACHKLVLNATDNRSVEGGELASKEFRSGPGSA
jgi:hypothetical protein